MFERRLKLDFKQLRSKEKNLVWPGKMLTGDTENRKRRSNVQRNKKKPGKKMLLENSKQGIIAKPCKLVYQQFEEQLCVVSALLPLLWWEIYPSDALTDHYTCPRSPCGLIWRSALQVLLLYCAQPVFSIEQCLCPEWRESNRAGKKMQS